MQRREESVSSERGDKTGWRVEKRVSVVRGGGSKAHPKEESCTRPERAMLHAGHLMLLRSHMCSGYRKLHYSECFRTQTVSIQSSTTLNASGHRLLAFKAALL